MCVMQVWDDTEILDLFTDVTRGQGVPKQLGW